tara:strand:- start:12102 stop:12263 length:162 start_codon:yes stop_codon:yes gene_type:complete
MKECLIRLLKNIYRLQKLPIERYNWSIEMAILNLDIEINDFIKKYENKKLSSK